MHVIRILSIVFLVAATGWARPSDLVLCIAPAGHIAIESGQERCGAPEGLGHRDEDQSTAGLAHREACCAPCADHPLGSSVYVRSNGPGADLVQLKAPAALAAAATPLVCVARVADHSRIASLHGAGPPSTPALQTIPLRC